jgi:thiaminase/transcriptional activator TenA
MDVEQSPLIRAAGDLWRQATQARFLDAVAAGTLPSEAFQRWLVQDYFFARGLLMFQALMLAKAPRAAQQLLCAGLTALDGELTWFEQHHARLRLTLEAPPHPTCRRYVDFLIAAAHTQPFGVLAAILFGGEVSYLAAWSALKTQGPYAEFIARWSNPQFAQYVRRLQQLAEAHPSPQAQDCFNEVLRHEHDFWRMTWEG